MDEKKSPGVTGISKSIGSIPPPVLQAHFVKPPLRKRLVRWGVATLVACILYCSTQHYYSLRTNALGNQDLLRAYMEHIYKGHDAPLSGKKAERVFL